MHNIGIEYKGFILNNTLDSFNTEINDSHRGVSNSVEQVKVFLKKVSAERKYIALECVLTQKNYLDIENYLEKIKDFPISEVRFQPVVAMSQNMIGSELYLNDEEIQVTKARVEELAETIKYTRVRFVDQSNTVIAGYRNTRNWGGIIAPDGELAVNAYLPFRFGKISNYGGMKSAWDKGFAHAWNYPPIYGIINEINSVNAIIGLHKRCDYKMIHIDL